MAMTKGLNGFPRERAVVAGELARNRAGGSGAGGYGVGQDDSWVEIGCHVANARLVMNVQFSVPTDA